METRDTMDRFRSHPDLSKYNKEIQAVSKSPLFPAKQSAEGGDFNLLYYCFLIGISAGEREDGDIKHDQVEWPQAGTNWPSAFGDKKYLVISLLITGYAAEMKYKLNSKTYTKILNDIVDHNKSTSLSPKGIFRFSAYAYRGFEILKKKVPHPSGSASTFIKINEILQKNFSKAPWV